MKGRKYRYKCTTGGKPNPDLEGCKACELACGANTEPCGGRGLQLISSDASVRRRQVQIETYSKYTPSDIDEYAARDACHNGVGKMATGRLICNYKSKRSVSTLQDDATSAVRLFKRTDTCQFVFRSGRGTVRSPVSTEEKTSLTGYLLHLLSS